MDEPMDEPPSFWSGVLQPFSPTASPQNSRQSHVAPQSPKAQAPEPFQTPVRGGCASAFFEKNPVASRSAKAQAPEFFQTPARGGCASVFFQTNPLVNAIMNDLNCSNDSCEDDSTVGTLNTNETETKQRMRSTLSQPFPNSEAFELTLDEVLPKLSPENPSAQSEQRQRDISLHVTESVDEPAVVDQFLSTTKHPKQNLIEQISKEEEASIAISHEDMESCDSGASTLSNEDDIISIENIENNAGDDLPSPREMDVELSPSHKHVSFKTGDNESLPDDISDVETRD
eukprot:14890345-Ditylum_brightwellii.AAC.1